MPSFVYFVTTRKKSLLPTEIEELGLGLALAGGCDQRPIYDTPWGESGIVLAPHGAPPEKLAVVTEGQRWAEAFGRGYRVGIWDDWTPTPEDLLRPGVSMVQKVAPVTLGDGLTWLLPVLISSDGDPLCERHVTLTPDGDVDYESVIEPLLPLVARLGEYVQKINELYEQKSVTFDDACVMDLVLEVLRVRYAIGRAEANLLGLLTTGNWATILNTAISLQRGVVGFVREEVSDGAGQA